MNKEERKQYNREYRLAHKKTLKVYHKEYDRKYRLAHEEAAKAHDKEYYKKIKLERPWVVHFKGAKQRCNDSSHINYKYYGGKDIKFKLTIDEVKALYLMNNAKDMKRPSIDRIYSDGNYTFGNCRFIELSENIKRRFK